MTDSYKHSHPYQYPKDANYFFYLESRGTVNSDLLRILDFLAYSITSKNT